MSRYADQVERFLETFPREQVFIYLFDDLRQNPRPTMTQVCEFLDNEPRVMSRGLQDQALPRQLAGDAVHVCRVGGPIL